MDNAIVIDTRKYTFELSIEGKKYHVGVFPSVDDLESLSEEKERTNNNYRLIVSRWIYNNMSEKESVSIELICNQPTSFFESAFSECFDSFPDLKEYYDETNGADICQRYVTAYEKYIPQMISKALEQFMLSLEKMRETISNGISHFIEANKTSIATSVASSLSAISEGLRSVRVPGLSTTEREAICDRYRQWGEYGWTLPPMAPKSLFMSVPKDSKEANKSALRYCTRANINQLFSTISKQNGIRKNDVEEARDCFNEKKYKSCSMIMFSLIDNQLISAQPKTQRKVGKKAIEKFQNILNSREFLKKYGEYLFESQNVIACLYALYKPQPNFAPQLKQINRNFLMHGMVTRKIKRMDCVQILLLYYHVVHLINIIKEIYNAHHRKTI